MVHSQQRTRHLAAALLVVSLGLGSTSRAEAGILFFTSRPVWQTAAGSSTFTEDFSGFAVDTSFQTSAVTLNGMTIQEEGAAGIRNLVDVVPLLFTPNSGTNEAELFTNFPEVGSPGTQVRITFTELNGAFGFDSWNVGTAVEVAGLEVYNGATLLGSQALSLGSGAFLGYVLTGGDTATSVRFASTTLIPGSGGDGFQIDNLAGVSVVPEPSSAALTGLGLGLLWLASRKRRRGRIKGTF